MDKEKYIAKSKKQDLPPRCPLIKNCERWAWTIYFYNFFDSEFYLGKELDAFDKLREYSLIDDNFEKNCQCIKSEHPEFLRNRDRISWRNMCPEINLFDETHSLNVAFGTNNISGEYDDLRDNKKLKLFTYRHYTDCLEFSDFLFEHLDKKKISKYYRVKGKRRTPISKKLRFEIFIRDNYTCQYCNRTLSDGIKLEIDHVLPISEGGTDDYENLITACQDCNRGKSNKLIKK
jgi:5-methylcytosine-specific restriction endonuclease McrA